MSTFIFDQFGIRRKLSDLNAVERLFKLKEKSGSNPWPVISECINIWQSTNPREYKSFLFDLGTMKQTRKNKYASSTDKVTGGILRYTLDIPEKVMFMIRCIYSPQELDMNHEFFVAWAKKYPQMKVAEKL